MWGVVCVWEGQGVGTVWQVGMGGGRGECSGHGRKGMAWWKGGRKAKAAVQCAPMVMRKRVRAAAQVCVRKRRYASPPRKAVGGVVTGVRGGCGRNGEGGKVRAEATAQGRCCFAQGGGGGGSGSYPFLPHLQNTGSEGNHTGRHTA